MKTAIRRPKIRKPSKGMKQFLKQNTPAKIVKKIFGVGEQKQWYHSLKAMRSMWLDGFDTGHTPRQGAQEKARRVRQLERGIILP